MQATGLGVPTCCPRAKVQASLVKELLAQGATYAFLLVSFFFPVAYVARFNTGCHGDACDIIHAAQNTL
jgi:hypothetical protein